MKSYKNNRDLESGSIRGNFIYIGGYLDVAGKQGKRFRICLVFEKEELYNENMKNKVVDFGSDQKERNIKKGYSVMSKRMLISVITVLMMGLCACGGQQGSAGNEPVGNVPGGNEPGISQETEYQQGDEGQEEWTEPEVVTEGNVGDVIESKEAWQDLTDEQTSMLSEYMNVVYNLNKYAEDQNNYAHKRSEEVGELYQKLVALAPLDEIPEAMVRSYFEHQYYDGDLDRQGLLDRFTVLEDVAVYQTQTVLQHSGKESSKTQISWNYNEEGEVCWENAFNNDQLKYIDLVDYDIQREYDADGRLAKTLYYERGELEYTVVHTYDANGYLIHEKRFIPGYENNAMEYEITCDDQGRVIMAHWQDFWDTTITYEYDAAGHMVKAEKVESYNGENHLIVEYQYDDNGALDTGSVTYWTTGFSGKDETKQVNTVDYTCDDQGRVIRSVMTVGHVYFVTGDNAGNVVQEQKNATVTIETVYGNYYFFQ